MPCFHPLKGYWAKQINPTGKRNITFNPKEAWTDKKIDLPCGNCDGCKLERSRQWAIRCIHEKKMHNASCFVTLTYSEEKLPKNGTLIKKDMQDFMKRLRKKIGKVRYFYCGEYGDLHERPHYHVCLFGHNFPDRKSWKTINGNECFRSETLEKLWPHGNSMIGELTFESAAYVARYIMKKQGRVNQKWYYSHENENGEIIERLPEYVDMSRRPGIGKNFFDKYKKDIFSEDFVIIRGKKMKPPKFYMGQYEITDPEKAKKIKAKRKNLAEKQKDENNHERLKVKEYISKERAKQLKRKYEGGTSE